MVVVVIRLEARLLTNDVLLSLAAEINAIIGQIAELQHRLDVLRKNKARKAKSKTSKPSTKHTTATYSTPSAKPPKAPKNGSTKPKKASNGVNGSASKKQRRESATIYADDDGDESEGGDVVEQVTLAQKQELADKIQEAGVDVLNQAIQIIQETTSLGDVSSRWGRGSLAIRC